MSIVWPINSSLRRVTIAASAGQTDFAFDFPLQDINDLQVISIVAGVKTPLILAVQFSVLDGWGNSGGTVRLVTPAIAGQKIRIKGQAVLTRLTSIVTAGAFKSKSQDDEHDRHRIIQQELRRDVDQSIQAEPGVVPPILIETLTPGQLISINDTGDMVSSGINPEDIALAAQADQAAARAEEALADILAEVDARLAVKLQRLTVNGQTDYLLNYPVPALNGHLHVNVVVGGVLQPKDGVAYTIISGGTTIHLSENPGDNRTLYVDGAATYSTNTVDSSLASSVGNDSTAPGVTVKDALENVLAATGATSVWTSSVTRTMQERSKFICHVVDFDVDPTGANDSTDGLEDWLAEAMAGGVKAVIGSDGSGPYNYIIQRELEITKAGQVVHFDQTGGYSYADNFGDLWQANGKLTVAGSWFASTGKRIRSRRKFRASISDPQDDPISAVINIQAQGVRIENPHLWLYKNYGFISPTDYGADVDVGIFNGCRVGTEIDHPTIIGHFRKAGIHFDVTHKSGLARHLDRAGNPYQDGSELSGSDGCRVIEPYIRGSWKAIAILGASPKAGETTYTDAYYDQQAGVAAADGRGAVGFSDFYCWGGKLWSVDHESNYRAADPTLSGGSLNLTSLLAEPESMPAIVHIDGMAGQASGAIWNMSFHRTRLATMEAFRVRLGRAARVEFHHCHFDGRNGSRKNTAGADIDTNNYILHSYGDVSGIPHDESPPDILGVPQPPYYGTSRIKVLNTPRSSLANGIGPHYYGASIHYETASGIVAAPIFSGIEDFEARSSATGKITFRNDNTTALAILNGGINSNTTLIASNVYVSGANVLLKSVSGSEWKTNIEDMDEGWRTRLPKWSPKWYRPHGTQDPANWSFYGLLAEDVAEIDVRYVHFQTEEFALETRKFLEMDEDGVYRQVERQIEVTYPLAKPKPTGVQYDRIICDLLKIAQDLTARVEALEAERGTP